MKVNSQSTRIFWVGAAFCLALVVATPLGIAAPVFIQDYEPPGDLDAPFNFQPDFSGSTRGALNPSSPNDPGTSDIALDTTTGARGTSQSALLTLVDDPLNPGGIAGSAYSIRFLPNAAGSGADTFATDGFVGFYLKAPVASAAAELAVAPLLESAGTGDATGGILQPVIADGRWHLYEWDMDDPAQFPNIFDDFYGAAGLGDTTLEPTVHFDSIAIIAFGAEGQSSAILNIDQIGYNNDGSLAIPEPSTYALAGAALIGFGFLRRQR